MQPLLSLSIYLCIVLVGGALLAPILYHVVEGYALSSGFWRALAAQPFHRFVGRAMLTLAFLGLFPFLRSVGIRHWQDVGLVKTAGQGRRFWTGFALGLGLLAILAGGQLLAGRRSWEIDDGLWTVPALVAAALLVGFLEELLFRGALFGALRRTYHWVVALLISSALYALVHFFQKPPQPSEVAWWTGLVTLGQMFAGFSVWERSIPGFLCLALAGTILGLGYQRTGSLYFSIGLHSSWVFWARVYGQFTDGKSKINSAFWGSRKLIDGWGAVLLLSLLLLLVIFWRPAARLKA